MYSTSGEEDKLYFIICFNKSRNIYILKKLLDCMGDGLVV